jgi:antitoxin component YwqK of YwqJK toxin-antitoxin module
MKLSNLFNSKIRTFNKKIKQVIKATYALENMFLVSPNEVNDASNKIETIREWWINNVDQYKNEKDISDDDFLIMQLCLNLPNEAKYRKTHGPLTSYYSNGQLEKEWNYKNGAKHGRQRGWHENGQIHYEHNYKEDHMDGYQQSWHENGAIESENNYKFTIPNEYLISENIGWQREYYENGSLKKEEYYDEQTYKQLFVKNYRENATIWEQREFVDSEDGKHHVIVKEYDENEVLKRESSFETKY